MRVSKKILLVDDEPDVLQPVAFRLTKSGYDIVTATNGEKAIEMIKTEKPDLVLLDLRLPGINGIEVCRMIRSDAALKNTPIILFTASANNIVEDCARCGANDYIIKPFDSKDLMEKIKKHIL